MPHEFRVTVFGEPRGDWHANFPAAKNEAVRLGLASWDESKREWFIAVPVGIERRGAEDFEDEPARRDRQRERWSPEDIARLRLMAREGETVPGAAARTGRSQEAVAKKARLHGIELKPARRGAAR